MTDAPRLRPATAPTPWSRVWLGAVLPTPTARLAAVVAASAVLAVALPVLWIPIAVAAVALVVIEAVRCVPPWEIMAARTHASSVVLGRSTDLVWHLGNPSPHAVRVTVADDLAPSLSPSARSVTVDLPAGSVATATATLEPTRRGRRSPTELTIRVASPLRLVTRQHRRPHHTQLDVHPRFRSRQATELRITRGRILDAGIRSARSLGRGTEFDQLRDYTPDDEFRRIDWAATARRGSPIVRTYRAERNQSVHVLLDTGRTMAGLVDGVPRLDHAMDAVLALGTATTRLGDKISLLAYSSRLRAEVPVDGRGRQVTALAEGMFALEPELVESDHELAITHTIARHRRRSLLVLFTELSGEALTEILVPSLPLLLRHHVVLVAATQDPEVETWRAATPVDPDGVFRAAGAVTVLQARQRTVALLQRLGAIVVDAPPDDLAGRVVDAYLGVKATNRL